jgi:hypothetical protein
MAILLNILCVAALLLQADPSAQARAVDAVKQVRVRVLEPALPAEPFEAWLRSVIGGQWTWEVNDCGEQTGDPAVDRQRDLPFCVEARATTRSVRGVDSLVGVQIGVGTERTGIHGNPRVRWIYIEEGSSLGEVPSLAALPEAVAALRGGPSPYYRAGLAAAVSACCAGLRLPGGRDMLAPWSLTTPGYAIEGDFNGDDQDDAVVLLVDPRAGEGPTLAVFHGQDGRYELAYRQKVAQVDDISIAKPQEIVIRRVKRGEEWTPERGDARRTYPHAFDAIELSTHKTAAGAIDTRLHLIYWSGGRYLTY